MASVEEMAAARSSTAANQVLFLAEAWLAFCSPTARIASQWRQHWRCILLAPIVLVSACGGGSDGETPAAAATPQLPAAFAVPKASCGTGDKAEPALQGQVPAAVRQAGFDGYSCNMTLVGQFAGEGGNWSAATHRDRTGRRCAYFSTAYPTDATGNSRGRVSPGVPVLDVSDPTKPTQTMSLTTAAMLDPWESLRVNARRQLLIADNGANGGGGAEIDVYDVSADCGAPQLFASAEIGTGVDGGIVSSGGKPSGHEGNISPDGLTYYVGDIANGFYRAIDLTDPSRPRQIATYDMKANGPGGLPHGMSVSEDGNRVYVVSAGIPAAADVGNPAYRPTNGFQILDTSDVQARKPSPNIRTIATVTFKDGSTAQHTIPVKIGGKPYLVMVDEGGAGGYDAAMAKLACNAGMTPFPMARIYDISDEAKPTQVSHLALETHDPTNCDKVLPDIVGLSAFTYGSHYCSVDNRENATAMACSYFNSGVRVFDIRDPAKPKELAYYNPAGSKVQRPGSSHAAFGSFRSGAPDWCASRADFDFERGMLTTMCQDNGLLLLRFAPGTWPFADSTPSMAQN